MSDNSLYLILNPLQMYVSECDEKLQRIKELFYQSSGHFTPLTLKADTAKPLPVDRSLKHRKAFSIHMHCENYWDLLLLC